MVVGEDTVVKIDGEKGGEISEEIEVSVIIPIYNSIKYLRRTLLSLHFQTLRSIEFICVVDCPTDGSDKIVQEFANLDERFRVVFNKINLGVSGSRNVGVALSRGKYVGFADDDDISNHYMFEHLLNVFRGEGVDVVCCDVSTDYYSFDTYRKFDCNESYDVSVIDFVHSALLPEGVDGVEFPFACAVWNKLYRLDVIRNNGIKFLDRQCFLEEDTLFNLAYLAAVRGGIKCGGKCDGKCDVKGVSPIVVKRLPLPLYCWNNQRIIQSLNYQGQSNVEVFFNYFKVVGQLFEQFRFRTHYKRRIVNEMWSWRFYSMYRSYFLGDIRALSLLFGRELRMMDLFALKRVYGWGWLFKELLLNCKTVSLFINKNLCIGLYCLVKHLAKWRFRCCCQSIMQ